ncbi:class I SAM-dependent methyltransferase [Gordoniibacillus kamchatkensis]
MKAVQEKLLFLNKFLQDPRHIGSVTPSSTCLARKMTEPVPWSRIAHIAELGAGTGAITNYIHAARRSDTRVLLFEKDVSMREQLAGRFPDCSCHEDAAELQTAMRREGIEQLDCILSGLPFFNFPQALRERLMDQIAASLKPGGLFIAFQYSQQMRKQLATRFHIEHVHFVPLNFPPAFVYVCRKGEG